MNERRIFKAFKGGERERERWVSLKRTRGQLAVEKRSQRNVRPFTLNELLDPDDKNTLIDFVLCSVRKLKAEEFSLNVATVHPSTIRREGERGREGVLPRWNNTRLSDAYDHAFMRHNADCRMKIE